MFLSVVILGRFTTETQAMAPLHHDRYRYLHHIWGRTPARGVIVYDGAHERRSELPPFLSQALLADAN